MFLLTVATNGALKKKSYRKPLRPVPGPVPKFFDEQNEFLPPGPGSRWEIFSKNATFQLDKWTWYNDRIFYIFLIKMKIIRFL